jgi:holo-[acyl-carrier protein] synthase
MMKCGIDIVDTPRIARMIQRRGVARMPLFWTPGEIAECTAKDGSLKIDSLAARFACKEAVVKALGTGFYREGIKAPDIEILRHRSGEPYVTLHGNAKTYFARCGYTEIAISLTHTETVAAAVCVLQ